MPESSLKNPWRRRLKPALASFVALGSERVDPRGAHVLPAVIAARAVARQIGEGQEQRIRVEARVVVKHVVARQRVTGSEVVVDLHHRLVDGVADDRRGNEGVREAEIRAHIGGWIKAQNRHARGASRGRRQTCQNRVDLRLGRDRCPPRRRLPQAKSLVGCEVKCLVLANGTAERAAELIAVELGNVAAKRARRAATPTGWGIEEVPGVEFAIAEELEKAAVHLVSAAPQGHVDLRAAAAPECRRRVARLHLEFVHGFQGKLNGVLIVVGVIVIDAVHLVVVGLLARAVDADRACRPGKGKLRTVSGSLRARRQHDERQKISLVQRQFGDLLPVDHLPHSRSVGFQRTDRRRDDHRECHFADFQADIERDALVHIDSDLIVNRLAGTRARWPSPGRSPAAAAPPHTVRDRWTAWIGWRRYPYDVLRSQHPARACQSRQPLIRRGFRWSPPST